MRPNIRSSRSNSPFLLAPHLCPACRSLLPRRSYATPSSSPLSFPYPSTPNPTPYDIFHLPRTATGREIKSRYYQLIRIHHPDTQPSVSSPDVGALNRTERFKTLVRAYDLLRDDTRRVRYLRTGEGWGGLSFSSGGSRERWEAEMRDLENRWRGQGASWGTRGQASNAGAHSGRRYAEGWDHEFYWSAENHPGQGGGKHEPYYTSNGVFISGLILLTLIANAIQYPLHFPWASASPSDPSSAKPHPILASTILDVRDARHLDAARSLGEAREGRERWGRVRLTAARRSVREKELVKVAEEMEKKGSGGHGV